MDVLQNKEKFPIEKWVSDIPKLAKQAKQLSLASHVCKFSHPDARASSIISKCHFKNDGYLRSGNIEFKNVEYKLDAFGNAAAVGTFRFLFSAMDDGKTILEHLEKDTEEIRALFNHVQGDYEKLREEFLAIKKNNQEMESDERIKQVYFPVGNDYHLLSLLTSSLILGEVSSRINEMKGKAKDSRDESNERYGKSYDAIYDLTGISFGGTKPQNVSVLNLSNKGKAYLLSSCPPTIVERKVIKPKRDFFYNTLQIKSFRDDFQHLHTLFIRDRNNLEMRNKIKTTINVIIDHVMSNVYKLREIEAGWSSSEHYSQLTLAQKIWLDDIHVELREKKGEWLAEVVNSFAQWILRTYERVLNNDRMILGDGEMAFLQNQIEEALLQDKENFG